MWHVWETVEILAGLRWRDLMERDNFEDLSISGSTILK